jgi:hypothetical protein
MSRAVSAMKPRSSRNKPIFTQLTLEEEILSLQEVAPETLDHLPRLFAEAVVDSATKVLGAATGEALIRWIGDRRLRDPVQVYSRLDSFLMGGSDEMKHSIDQEFRRRVHGLYRLAMGVVATSQA